MNSKQFIKIISNLFNEWLNTINEFIKKRELTISGEYSFNHVLRVAESPTHFICELCGSKKYKPNELISVNVSSNPEKYSNGTTSYFWSRVTNKNQVNILIKIDSSSKGSSFSGISLGLISSKTDFNIIVNKIKLPVLKTKLFGNSEKFDIPFFIQPEADYILFNNIELLETDGISIFYRIIPTAIIIKKPVDENELINQFEKFFIINYQSSKYTKRLIGLNTNYNSTIEHFANELLSLSNQNIKETVIDSFIQKHSDFFVKSLGYKNALSQKILKWIERNNNDPVTSIPDYLMEREDGFYDILDLKTGAIKYKSITKSKKNFNSKKSRIRFVEYVNELISQLNDYKRYFSFEKNRDYAYNNFGVKVKDIKLIGIIGNYNNFDREEVDISLQIYKDDISILSYYEIRNLLRKIDFKQKY